MSIVVGFTCKKISSKSEILKPIIKNEIKIVKTCVVGVQLEGMLQVESFPL